ncbi:RimK family alpha-L-glutamate ligase [Candidatus Uhrbacteria bacterium]|nr:RimK family alpha-L-glutamate ligase [Candidatus Uhrbacteria bacterium]
MRFAILTFELERKELKVGTKMLVKRARELGHRVTVIREHELQIRFGGEGPSVLYKGKPLPEFDAIIVRPGIREDPSVHAALLRQLELEGLLVINGYLGVHRAKNKIRTLQLLDHFGLPVPKTVVIFSATELESAIADFSFPLILKTAYGSGGTGVFIAESKRSLKPFLQYLTHAGGNPNTPVKIQEYIKEAKGKDLRVFVVGKEVVAAMERTAKQGEFRANVHQGGSAAHADITEEEKRLCIEATRRLGLNIAGVDMLRRKSGPVIIEVNSYPGLGGISQATGVDVAGAVVRYAERKVNKRRLKAQEAKGKEMEHNSNASEA